jgi:hypothetical protein
MKVKFFNIISLKVHKIEIWAFCEGPDDPGAKESGNSCPCPSK